MSPPSSTILTAPAVTKSLNVIASSPDVPILPPSSTSAKPPKIYFLHRPWLWLADLEKTVWLPWHSPASLDHIRWKEGNGQLWPSLTLINASESLLDLACGGWTDASLSSPDILGRRADMHRHQKQHTEEKSTLVSISSRNKQQAGLPFLTPHSSPQPFIGVHSMSAALGLPGRVTRHREWRWHTQYYFICFSYIFVPVQTYHNCFCLQ